MPKQSKDITGQTFNRLTVIKRIGSSPIWKCKCQCGRETSARAYTLISGGLKSCGCLHRDNAVKMAEQNFHREWKRIWQRNLRRANRRLRKEGDEEKGKVKLWTDS